MKQPTGAQTVRNLELRHLRLLDSLARSGSIRAVAASSGLAQSNVSQQLRRIEQHFAAPLFSRGTRGIEPTEYGASVLARVSEILRQVDEITAAPRS